MYIKWTSLVGNDYLVNLLLCNYVQCLTTKPGQGDLTNNIQLLGNHLCKDITSGKNKQLKFGEL